jgi:hypothetical protein
MAAGDLARKVSKKLEEQGRKKAGRKELIRVKGQLLVIDRVRFDKILVDIFGEDITGELDGIWSQWDAWLRGRRALIKDTDRLQELDSAAATLAKKPTERVYVISSYKNIANEKGSNGVLGKIIKKYVKGTEEQYKRIGGQKDTGGGVLGHEEAGRGIAQAGVAALKAEKIVASSGLSAKDKARFQNVINKFKQTVTVSMEHTQVLSENGDVSIKYVPVLTWQSETTNAQMGKIEADALTVLQNEFRNFATMEGSTPFVDAASAIIFNNVAPKKKRKGTKVQGTRKKSIRERSKASSKSNIPSEREVTVVRDSGINRNRIAGLATTRKQFDPLQMIGLINGKLSQIVRKNMRPPGLQNQTGNFASSVQIKDVSKTRQGYLSFGYTYEKDPYQVFEVGTGSAPWATPGRDPRKLIDKSIREIAAQMALGRFYTRRL